MKADDLKVATELNNQRNQLLNFQSRVKASPGGWRVMTDPVSVTISQASMLRAIEDDLASTTDALELLGVEFTDSQKVGN